MRQASDLILQKNLHFTKNSGIFLLHNLSRIVYVMCSAGAITVMVKRGQGYDPEHQDFVFSKKCSRKERLL
jgi:hypothetical protein